MVLTLDTGQEWLKACLVIASHGASATTWTARVPPPLQGYIHPSIHPSIQRAGQALPHLTRHYSMQPCRQRLTGVAMDLVVAVEVLPCCCCWGGARTEESRKEDGPGRWAAGP